VLTGPIDLVKNDELGDLQRFRESFGSTSTILRLVAKGHTSVEAEQQKSLLEHAAYVYECKGTNLSKD
jgi:hypothetical protein